MHVVSSTPTRLVVRHQVPRGMIRNCMICAGFILLLPVVLQMRGVGMDGLGILVSILLVILFASCAAFAYHLWGCSESYSIDAERQLWELTRTTRTKTTKHVFPFAQVRDVFQETTVDTEYANMEYIVLTLDPSDKRLKLPIRLYTFTAKERAEFAGLVGAVLGRRLRLVEKSSALFGKTKVHY